MSLGDQGTAVLGLAHGELGAPQLPTLDADIGLPPLTVAVTLQGDLALAVDVMLPAPGISATLAGDATLGADMLLPALAVDVAATVASAHDLTAEVALPPLDISALAQVHLLAVIELTLPRLRGPDDTAHVSVALPAMTVAADIYRPPVARDAMAAVAMPALLVHATLRDPRVDMAADMSMPRLGLAAHIVGLDAVSVPLLAPLPLSPNWAHGMQESYEWRTDVLRANDGSEQRIRVRRFPRRGIEFRALVAGRQAQAAVLAVRGLIGRVCAVGLWMHAGRLAADVAAGTATLPVAVPDIAECRPGAGVLIWHDELLHEHATVLAVDAQAQTLTLATPLQRSWPAGTRVVPTQAMRLEQARIQHPSAAVAEIHVQATDEWGTPIDESARWTGPVLTPTHPRAGGELLLQRPDWAEPPQAEYLRDLARIDSVSGPVWSLERGRSFVSHGFGDFGGGGDYSPDEIGGRAHYRRTLRYLLGDRTGIRRWLAWLGWAGGRLRAFWCPTHSLDMAVDADGHVDVSHLTDWLALGERSRLAWVSHRHGMAALEIGAQSVAALWLSTETLGLFAHWLERVRLDADRIAIHWETDGIARLDLPVVSCWRDARDWQHWEYWG